MTTGAERALADRRPATTRALLIAADEWTAADEDAWDAAHNYATAEELLAANIRELEGAIAASVTIPPALLDDDREDPGYAILPHAIGQPGDPLALVRATGRPVTSPRTGRTYLPREERQARIVVDLPAGLTYAGYLETGSRPAPVRDSTAAVIRGAIVGAALWLLAPVLALPGRYRRWAACEEAVARDRALAERADAEVLAILTAARLAELRETR